MNFLRSFLSFFRDMWSFLTFFDFIEIFAFFTRTKSILKKWSKIKSFKLKASTFWVSKKCVALRKREHFLKNSRIFSYEISNNFWTQKVLFFHEIWWNLKKKGTFFPWNFQNFRRNSEYFLEKCRLIFEHKM